MTTQRPFGRRALLSGAGLLPLAALAACSGESSDSSSASGSASGSDAGSSSGERTVTDAMGTKVTVPANPTKVVILHYAGVQAALDLGVVPIGMGEAGDVGAKPEDVVPSALWDQIKDVPVVTNSSGEPEIEKIAGLEPDLILAHNVTEEDVIKQLGEIAPVYQWTLRGKDRADWQLRVKEVADALNKTSAYDQLKSDWDKTLADVKDKRKDVIDGLVVGVLSSYSEGNFYAWAENNMPGTILTPLGLTYSSDENKIVEATEAGQPEAEVSVEKIGDAFGDVTILFHDSDLQGKGSTFLDKVQGSALYKDLAVVKAGNVFPFFKTTVAGFTDAKESLDFVDKALGEYKKA